MLLGLLVSTTYALADARSAAGRLALVPLTPGGAYDHAPVYDLSEVDQAVFGVFLDPELRGQVIDDYLEDRALLCAAKYTVELYALGADDALPETPLGELGPQTGYSFGTGTLEPGGTYAWRVVARIDGRATIASVPLYFRLAPQPREIPPAISLEGLAVATHLQRAAVEQRRSASALALSLAGMRLFETFPTATDSFICTPLGSEYAAPLPGQLRAPAVTIDLLGELGGVLAGVQAAKVQLWATQDASAQLGELTARMQALARSVVYGPLVARSESNLLALASNLNAAEPEAALAGLSQLELAIDALVGPGTLNLQQDYQQSLRAYATSSEKQLRRASELVPYFTTLDSARGAAWDALIEQQLAAMVLLREEVERGRLARPQLRQRIAQNRQRLAAQLSSDYKLLDGLTCRLPPERARRVNDSDPAQVRQLEVEVAACRLTALLIELWPEL